MNLDQILNLAQRFEIYSGAEGPTVDVTLPPVEIRFLAQLLKTVTGGTPPQIPDANGWVKGDLPKKPEFVHDEHIIVEDNDGDVGIFVWVDDEDTVAGGYWDQVRGTVNNDPGLVKRWRYID